MLGAKKFQGDPESGKPKLCVMEIMSWLISSPYYFPTPLLTPFDPSLTTMENKP